MFKYLFGLLLIGCSANSDASVSVKEDIHPNIYNGNLSTIEDTQSLVFTLTTTGELCTGSVIADNVILSAKHCLLQGIKETVDCAPGHPIPTVGQLINPNNIKVYTGLSITNFTEINNVKSIFTTDGVDICNQDIAFIVLQGHLTNSKPLYIRASSVNKPGELIKSIGYGKTEVGQIGILHYKENIKIIAQGPVYAGYYFDNREFGVTDDICSGDSGSPAISQETGEIVGVTSRGTSCGEGGIQVYTNVVGYNDMIQQVFSFANSKPLLDNTITTPINTSHITTNNSNNNGCSIGFQYGNTYMYLILLSLILSRRLTCKV